MATYQRYVHLTGIPAFEVSGDPGAIYLDSLWERDLSRHRYVGQEVRVVCPFIEVDEAPRGTVRTDLPWLTFERLPAARSTLRYVLDGSWCRAGWRMWKQLNWADIAFIGFVEYPIPFGWTAVPAAQLLHTPWYTYLESTPWRVPPGITVAWKHRIRSAVFERVNGLLIRRATFAFVSQPAYESLLDESCPRLVSPASWFLHAEQATPDQITTSRVMNGTRRAHVAFIGRLDVAKGVGVLLDALAGIDQAGVELDVTFVGSGPWLTQLQVAAESMTHVHIALIEPLRYGSDFFEFIRTLSLVVVPSLGNEQPRIVFDAYSQGVGVLASATTGLRSVVRDDETGQLVRVGSATDLTEALKQGADQHQRALWAEYGDVGYSIARDYDHDDMHGLRAVFLRELNLD